MKLINLKKLGNIDIEKLSKKVVLFEGTLRQIQDDINDVILELNAEHVVDIKLQHANTDDLDREHYCAMLIMLTKVL